MTEQRSALAEIWPPARVRVVTPRLELRLPTDDELGAFGDVAAAGSHPPEYMPFLNPWSDETPEVIRESAFRMQWRNRADWQADDWSCPFVVFIDGEPAGCQHLIAKDFGICREVDSGSWLGLAWQGRGLGREMREAMLHFAFESLGALTAISAAEANNAASIAVSRRCGYEPDGEDVLVTRRGPCAPGGPSAVRAIDVRFRLTRERWLERRRSDIVVHGFDDSEVRAMFGMEQTDG